MTSQNQALQQAILDSANYTIISTTVDGIITTFNQTAERWLGYQAAEVLGKTTPILIHDPQEVELRSQELSQELGITIEPGFEVFVAKARRGETDEGEWTYLRKDGSRFSVRLSVTALRDEQGEITGFLGIASDLTEAKQAAAELELFFGLSLDLLCLAGLDGYFKRVNPAFSHILGYSEAELLAQPFINFVHPEDRAATLAELSKLATGIPTIDFENRYRCQDGTYKWLAWKSFPVTEEGILYAVARDITEQKRAQAERLQLIERENTASDRLNKILESITDAFFTLDNRWCFTYINLQAELLLQRQRAELLGKNIWDEFPEAVGSTFYREYYRAVAEQVSVEFEEFYPPLDTWFAVHADPLENGLSVYFQDVTERKIAELENLRSEARLRKQQTTLIELAKNQVFYRSDLLAAVQVIAEKAAQTLEVEQVGIWFYREDRNSIYTLDRYELSQQRHSSGRELLATDYPFYFQALETGEILVAENAQNDPSTQEFRETWLVPHNVCSMMDVPIRSGGKTVGVICLEHVGDIRHWTIEEQNFASSLAHMISLAIEASDRTLAEAALRESEERFHGAFANAAIGMAIVSLEGRWLQVNRSLCEMVGYSESELRAMTFQEITHPDDLETDLGYVVQVMTGEIPYYHLEKRYLHKQGHIVWILLSVSLVRNSEGNPKYFVGQIQDITERKLAEAALRESEARFRTVADSAPVLLWMAGTDKLCNFFNSSWLRFTGRTLAEELGNGWTTRVHPEDFQYCLDTYNTAFNAREGFQIEYRLRRADGEYRWLLDTGRPRFLPDGSFAGYIGSCFDISDRRELEKLKDEFISVVSHELRTPLTSIQGALDLLAGGALVNRPDYAQHMLKIAAKNADRLVRLINDILDIERIESGKVTMIKQACDVAHLMNTVVDTVDNMAKQAEIELSITPISARVWADPDRIVQVLTNLLSNAIKFSEPGSTVWLTAATSNSNTPNITFQVSDRGRGIPAHKLETIFERFQQVDASDSRKKGGTGLGLAICRSIVQHHDGQIWVESILGEGSTFCFTLPLLLEEPEINTETNSSGPLILLCDDDPSVRTVVKTHLEQQNYRAIAVDSGQEAVAQAAQEHPDVILLNLIMPGMNGWETLANLKEQEATKNIPVIILSGLLPDNKKSHPEISDWLVKPPAQRFLFQALERALAKHNQNIRVLIVENDPDLAQVLMAMFERYGIQTYHAQTGREAIDLSQRIMPNLLVLDLVLPEYDGFAVVDWLRQHNRLCDLPLVVYTAQDIDRGDKERLKLGQTLFLTKGRINPEEFEQRVIKILNRLIRGIK
ncbi:putative Histidine kinase [Hyella patelloides LEGE 07179]|uniref:histidine kinase n=1 Tax=Hyella patelloides LEGE 07179 TaxID=945734 RepID=A0A563VQ48_9CYAN|nr:PAS domain S-box protein [Hyella patelloides]VEP13387.1 putative Histidine kinase [Hyella patelloides LEGE 07179]